MSETINITPTWSDVMPILIAAIRHGGPDGASVAEAELRRLAANFDAIVEANQPDGGWSWTQPKTRVAFDSDEEANP